MIEVRALGTAAAKGKRLVGIAAPFNSLSEDLGGFKELIRPGAFKRTISDGHTITALHHHDTGAVIGSTRSGSLKLRESARGLEFEITPPDTGLGRDILALAKRGDIANMSFGFRINGHDGETWRETKQGIVRELRDVELFEVSSTAFPAYSASSLSARDHNPTAERMTKRQESAEAKTAEQDAEQQRRRDRIRRKQQTVEAAAKVNVQPTPEPLEKIKARASRKRVEHARRFGSTF